MALLIFHQKLRKNKIDKREREREKGRGGGGGWLLVHQVYSHD